MLNCRRFACGAQLAHHFDGFRAAFQSAAALQHGLEINQNRRPSGGPRGRSGVDEALQSRRVAQRVRRRLPGELRRFRVVPRRERRLELRLEQPVAPAQVAADGKRERQILPPQTVQNVLDDPVFVDLQPVNLAVRRRRHEPPAVAAACGRKNSRVAQSRLKNQRRRFHVKNRHAAALRYYIDEAKALRRTQKQRKFFLSD